MKIYGREIFWNLPPVAPFLTYAIFGVVLLISAYCIYKRVLAYKRGREEHEDRVDDVRKRAIDTLKIGVFQEKVLERRIGGYMHVAIYSGFIALFICTCIVAVQYDLGIKLLEGNFYLVFKIFADTFGLVFLLGLLVAFVRRYVFRPKGLTLDGDDLLQLVLLLAITVTGFLIETVRLAVQHPAAAWASYASNAFAPFFDRNSIPVLLALHRRIWWIHMALAFGFLASVAYSKMLHMFSGPVNIFLRTSRPNGALQPIPKIEEEEKIGVADVWDLSWKELFSSDACTKCGRCQDECPAFAADKPLSPRDVVLKTRRELSRDLYWSPALSAAAADGHTEERTAPPFTFGVLFPDEIWSCTTCRACMQACPVLIEHIDMIVDVRRGYVANAKIPDMARTVLQKMGNTGNPWGLPGDDRTRWTAGADVVLAADKKDFEYLYWPGCAGAYDPRNQKVTRTLAALLNRAGVNYAILGREESCCGAFARVMGEEGLFALGMVERIRDVFAKYGVKKIITQCPHCFNTFKNEYPQFGVNVEVVHHTVFLKDLVDAGKLVPRKPLNRAVAFHDSCYLGRHNDIYDAPRKLLEAIPGIAIDEMRQSRERGFCCGGGGGGMWLELPGKRINHLRFDQAMKTGANSIGSACPYCLSMFDDAVKFRSLEQEIMTLDLAEMIAESL